MTGLPDPTGERVRPDPCTVLGGPVVAGGRQRTLLVGLVIDAVESLDGRGMLAERGTPVGYDELGGWLAGLLASYRATAPDDATLAAAGGSVCWSTRGPVALAGQVQRRLSAAADGRDRQEVFLTLLAAAIDERRTDAITVLIAAAHRTR